MEKRYLKYLPSKKFTIIAIVGIVFAVGIFILFFMSSSRETFGISGSKNDLALRIGNQTVNDLIEKDTDSDGITDWEEALWGTDKSKSQTFDGMSDDDYIQNKKKQLNVDQNVNVTKLTETEKFAREFFTSFSALKADGAVDSDTINGFSNALGQKIVNPDLIDAYTENDIKIDIEDDGNDPMKKLKYYAQVEKFFQSYEATGLGDELDIINNGLAASGEAALSSDYDKLPGIAEAYQDFAKKIMALTVPSELAVYHLQIANSSNNTGISVSNMAEIIRDPLIGVQGISQYQKYSEDLVKAVADLETTLAAEEDIIQ